MTGEREAREEKGRTETSTGKKRKRWEGRRTGRRKKKRRGKRMKGEDEKS